jgi:hypothetical protein
VSEVNDIGRELSELEADLKRLEAAYTMYFAGRLPRPPLQARTRINRTFRRLDRGPIANYGDRFRFSTLQARFRTLADLWDRGLRAREEGRPGPFVRQQSPAGARRPGADVGLVHEAAFRDLSSEPDKLRDLYERLAEARRQQGEDVVPFQRFSTLVRDQVRQLQKDRRVSEVSFRIALRDGKVSFTARGVKERSEGSS